MYVSHRMELSQAQVGTKPFDCGMKTSENTYRAYVICQQCMFLTGWKNYRKRKLGQNRAAVDTTGQHRNTHRA